MESSQIRASDAIGNQDYICVENIEDPSIPRSLAIESKQGSITDLSFIDPPPRLPSEAHNPNNTEDAHVTFLQEQGTGARPSLTSDESPEANVEMLEMRPHITEEITDGPDSVQNVLTDSVTYNIQVFFDELGYRNFNFQGRSLVSSICEKIVAPLNPGQKVITNDFHVIGFNQDGRDCTLEMNSTIDSVFGASIQEPSYISRVIVAYKTESHLFPITIQLQDNTVKTIKVSVFTPVKMAIKKILEDLSHNISQYENFAIFKRGKGAEVKLHPDETPFNTWSLDENFVFRKASSDISGSVGGDLSNRFIRVSFDNVSRMKPINSGTNVKSLIESMIDERNLVARPDNYKLFIVKEDGELVQILETEKVLQKVLEMNTNVKQLLVQDAKSDDTSKIPQMRAREFKRTQKLAGFFGVQKSEAEVKVLRKALVSSAQTSTTEASNSLNELRLSGSNNILNSKNVDRAISPVSNNSTKMENVKPTVEPEMTDEEKEAAKRTGKLAHFFGVKNNEQDVLQIRKLQRGLAKNGKPSDNDDQKVLIRIYLVDHTYKNLKVKITTVAGECVDLISKKLSIGEQSRGDYAIYEVTQSGTERCLLNEECVFAVMSEWHDKQIFVFKKKPTSATIESSDTAEDHAPDNPIKLKSKANKLAGFFGQEENYMLKALNTIHGIAGQEDGVNDLQTRKIQIDDILKEGWLVKLENPTNGHENWINCWCYIENRYFNISIKNSEEEESRRFSDIATILDGRTDGNSSSKRWCLPLHKSMLKEVQVKGKKFTFQITYQEKTVVSLQARSKGEYDDWITAIKTASGAAKPKDLKSQNSKGALRSAEGPGNNDPNTPLSIDNFEILRVLGQGQYGKVFLCSQKSTKQHYAVKVIKKDNNPDASLNENRILRGIRHPFIVGLHYAFQTKDKLFLVMEYVNGGELYFHLSKFGAFDEDRVRFYGAELLLALECLHGKGIVYRDLKLENILLDKDGHIKVADFGLSKQEDEKTEGEESFSGTVEYFSPEVLLEKRQSYCADWWAYGIVLFEMLCGFHPFYHSSRSILYARIIKSQVPFPDDISRDAKDLISKLLSKDPRQRLGSSAVGGKEIRDHPFFKSIDFQELFKRKIKPSFQPNLQDESDVKYFDVEFTEQNPIITPPDSSSLSSSQEISGFSYTRSEIQDMEP